MMPKTVEVKLCTKCGEDKPLSAFSKSSKSKDGLQWACKVCNSAYNKAHIARRLGLTLAEYVAMRETQARLQSAELQAGVRTCVACGEVKPLNEFSRRKIGRYGRNAQCRLCWAIYRKDRRVRTRDCQLQRDYGITGAEYDDFLASQGGVCAICGKTPEENILQLGVDHDHETGDVRGLLCGSCNRALGWFQDNLELLERAAQYLREGS